jgi:hypothetical protein
MTSRYIANFNLARSRFDKQYSQKIMTYENHSNNANYFISR